MNEQEILEMLGRPGVTVISRTPVTRRQTGTDASGRATSTEVETGEWRWVLSDGSTMVVRPDRSQVVGPERVGNGAQPTRWEVVNPPTGGRAAPAAPRAETQRPIIPFTVQGTRGPIQHRYNPASGQFEVTLDGQVWAETTQAEIEAFGPEAWRQADNARRQSHGQTLRPPLEADEPAAPRASAQEKPTVPFTSRGANGETYRFRWNPNTNQIETSTDEGASWFTITQQDLNGYGAEAQQGLVNAQRQSRGLEPVAPAATRTTTPSNTTATRSGAAVGGAAGGNNPPKGTREEHVVDGYVVMEIADGKGGWRIDPNVTPRPFVPEKETPPRTQIIQRNGRQILINADTGLDIRDLGRVGERPDFIELRDGTLATWDEATQSLVPIAGQPPEPPTYTYPGADPSQAQFTRFDQYGNPSVVENPNVIEPTPEDAAQRVLHAQRQATAYQQRLLQQVQSGRITDADADKLFDLWWNQHVETPRAQLEEQQNRQRAKDELELQKEQRTRLENQQAYERDRQLTGLEAGQAAMAHERALLPYRVGPTFGAEYAAGLNTLSSGGGPVNFSGSSFMFDMPDFEQVAQRATAQALGRISPYAAELAGMPMPQRPEQLDLDALLGSRTYRPPNPWGASAPPPAEVPAPALPGAPVSNPAQAAAIARAKLAGRNLAAERANAPFIAERARNKAAAFVPGRYTYRR